MYVWRLERLYLCTYVCGRDIICTYSEPAFHWSDLQEMFIKTIFYLCMGCRVNQIIMWSLNHEYPILTGNNRKLFSIFNQTNLRIKDHSFSISHSFGKVSVVMKISWSAFISCQEQQSPCLLIVKTKSCQ